MIKKSSDYKAIFGQIVLSILKDGIINNLESDCYSKDDVSEVIAFAVDNKYLTGVSYTRDSQNMVQFLTRNPKVTYEGLRFSEQ